MVFGRLADRYPLLGMRRTPYFFLGSLLSSLVFLALPGVAIAMGQGSVAATVAGFALLAVFGIGVAASGDSHHALIAEVTSEERRGGVIAVVWTFTIISAIAAAIVIKVVMGDAYSPEAMQRLYNPTPLIVLGTGLLGLLGIEKRRSSTELQALLEQSRAAAPAGNPVRAAASLIRDNRCATAPATIRSHPVRAAASLIRDNPQVRAFFLFVFLSILAIFMQDAILEVFGAELFGMTLRETTTFTQTWGGGVLGGMLLMGIVSSIFPLSKKLIATAGGAGTALGLGLLTICAFTGQRSLLTPAILLMGFATGLYNIGALSMMMSMTVEGATGLYMGMWGMAQAFGTGGASMLGGALKSALIETHLLSPNMGYATIFGIETVLMIVGIAVLRGVNIDEFKGITRDDLVRSMEVGAAA